MFAASLSRPDPSDGLNHDDTYFTALEAAMLRTPRGRWFLSEHARRTRSTEGAELLRAMESLTVSVNEARSNTSVEILRRELQEMSASIVQTRREIASIKPTESGNDKIVAATEELDHIVRSTERATADILTASERLQVIGQDLAKAGADGTLCSEIEEISTNIMLSCSFQDLTGQRTSKVVNALRYIEQRVNSMIEIWGINANDAKMPIKGHEDDRRDAHLLNGPAREGEGVSQDDIDRLMDDPIATNQNAAEERATDTFLATKGTAKPSPVAPPSMESHSESQSASQADIDALFD